MAMRVPLPMAGALLVVGCSLIPMPPANGSALAVELQGAQARWAASDIDDYQLTLQYNCFCPFRDPIRVSVVDGRVTSVTRLDGAAVNPRDVEWYPLLVESAFKTVQENLDADEIDVTFDAAFGFPAHVDANPDDQMFDEEFSFDVTDFAPGS
jgi:hypothetical protein